MNQTKKRLSIIKLAISITDIETIQLQTLKLTPIKTDAKIQEILSLLQAGNYAQAQALITTYIETAADEVLQRSSQEKKSTISDEDQAIIDEFDLFVTPSTNADKVVEVDMSDYPLVQPKIAKEKDTIDFDSLLNLEADDVLQDNIKIDIASTQKIKKKKDTFFEPKTDKTYQSLLDESPIQKDTFFEEMEEEPIKEKIEASPDSPEEIEFDKNILDTDEIDEIVAEKDDIFAVPQQEEEKDANINYKAMPHISQKLISIKKRYPLIQKTYERFDTVETLLTKIAQEGYSESEIEEMITYIKTLIGKAKYTEAAQLLLVCAATESKFAQFMLARELYTGSVLTKNIPEAFALMNTLALDNYPEALCDLGQFYENGIGTSPNPIRAEELYKDAVELDIKRAKKHYTRLKKQNRGFLKN